MKKLLILALLMLNVLIAKNEFYGEKLFKGNFKKNTVISSDQKYVVSSGDKIEIRLWGSYDYDQVVKVDQNGNIFIPEVGMIKASNKTYEELVQNTKNEIRKVFKKNVHLYLNIKENQEISIYVTGKVKSPGMYQGYFSDSVLQFIDKANGIEEGKGSFRKIDILRENKRIKEVDLYSFLDEGKVSPFSFKSGDVIRIGNLKSFIKVKTKTETKNYEIKKGEKVSSIMEKISIEPSMTSYLLSRVDEKGNKTITKYKIQNQEITIKAGDEIYIYKEQQNRDITIEIQGEYYSDRILVKKKGTSLLQVINQMDQNSVTSDFENIYILRKKVAEQQKALLEANLAELKKTILTTSSNTSEEAIIRSKEAESILKFIDSASKVELKGRVYINKLSDKSQIIMEEEDVVFVPKKQTVVNIQGEVKIPIAQTYAEGYKLKDYIDNCGGLTERASDNIMILRQNGKIVNIEQGWFDQEVEIEPGDSILVFAKVSTKRVQTMKSVTEIIYQLAVGAGVLLNTY